MKTILGVITLCLAVPAFAQTRMRPSPSYAASAESAVKQASDQFAQQKKLIERHLEILTQLREADRALADTMQPLTALEKAYEHVDKAKSLGPEVPVIQGVIRVANELESARRSAGSADFGRLRSQIRELALDPAARLAVRDALQLEEEMLMWIKVQEAMTAHLRELAFAAGQSLRATHRE